MIIKRAYKTELDPNNKQATFFGRCCGAARYVYNGALAEWGEWYDLGGNPSAYALKRYFNNQVKDEKCPWIRAVPYAIIDATFINLNFAFRRYFKEKKDGTVAKRIAKLKEQGKWAIRVKRCARRGLTGFRCDPGYPSPKKRGEHNSFQVRNCKIENDRIYVTRLGWVRLKEHGYIPTDAKKYGTYATISEKAGRWFISVLVEEEIPDPENGSVLTFQTALPEDMRSALEMLYREYRFKEV